MSTVARTAAGSEIIGGPVSRPSGSSRARSASSICGWATIASGGSAASARTSSSRSPTRTRTPAPCAARRSWTGCTATTSSPAMTSLRPARSSILDRIMADSADDRRIGTVIAGYRIDARIGRGGMGVVYRAQHLQLQREAALKLIAPDLAESSGFRERFAREARIAAALAHPNIVTVYDAGEVDGTLYLAMQYVEGPDLAAILAAEGRLRPYRAIDVCRQVAAALDAAHAHGLIHRDVKPANVLVEGRSAYLSDFGLGKRIEGGDSAAITVAGDVVGTIHYVAPEQIEGTKPRPPPDVYSLGCLLYHCLSGRLPFERENDVAVIYAHLSEPPPRLPADLPDALNDVLAKAREKAPDRRYTSCGEFMAAARAAIDSAGPLSE